MFEVLLLLVLEHMLLFVELLLQVLAMVWLFLTIIGTFIGGCSETPSSFSEARNLLRKLLPDFIWPKHVCGTQQEETFLATLVSSTKWNKSPLNSSERHRFETAKPSRSNL